MTATSVLNRSGPAETVRAWRRFTATIFAIAVLTVGAFAIGRTTSTTTTRPAQAPASVAKPATTPTAAYLRRLGRPF
jgi:hypothetical protein